MGDWFGGWAREEISFSVFSQQDYRNPNGCAWVRKCVTHCKSEYECVNVLQYLVCVLLQFWCLRDDTCNEGV